MSNFSKPFFFPVGHHFLCWPLFVLRNARIFSGKGPHKSQHNFRENILSSIELGTDETVYTNQVLNLRFWAFYWIFPRKHEGSFSLIIEEKHNFLLKSKVYFMMIQLVLAIRD